MPDEIYRAARDFARYCLNQPEPQLSRLHPDDIREVLPLVAHWCRLNEVVLEIHCFDEIYSCRFTDGNSLCRMHETEGSTNLCHQLLAGASNLAKCMSAVHQPHPARDRLISRMGG